MEDVLRETQPQKPRIGSLERDKVSSAADFIWSNAPLDILGSANALTFEDLASVEIKDHDLTTEEVKTLCNDLPILMKQDLKYLLKWRMDMRKALAHAQPNDSSTSEIQDDQKVLTNAVDQEKCGNGGLKRSTCFAIIVGPCLIMGADGELNIHRLVGDRIFALAIGDVVLTERVMRIVKAYCSAPFDLTVEYAAKLVQDEANKCVSRFSSTLHNNFLVGGRNVNGKLKLFKVCQGDNNIHSYETMPSPIDGQLIGVGVDDASLLLQMHASRWEELHNTLDVGDLEDQLRDDVVGVIHATSGDCSALRHISTITIPKDPSRNVKLT